MSTPWTRYADILIDAGHYTYICVYPERLFLKIGKFPNSRTFLSPQKNSRTLYSRTPLEHFLCYADKHHSIPAASLHLHPAQCSEFQQNIVLVEKYVF